MALCVASSDAFAAPWPKTRILFRGDAIMPGPGMARCEDHGVDSVFGLAGSKPLKIKVVTTADAVRTERDVTGAAVVRDYAETRHVAGSWGHESRVVVRIEATALGLDIRFIVTNLRFGAAA